MKFGLRLFGVSPRYYGEIARAASAPALRRAGRLGDGWIEIGSPTLEAAKAKLDIILAFCKRFADEVMTA
jgi:hypothetical protein